MVMSVLPAMAAQTETSEPVRLTILGSTGSVGCNTIDLVERNRSAFEIEALTAFRNVELLAAQARRLRPKLVVVGDAERYRDLKAALSGEGIEVAAGAAALVDAASRPVDRVMAAIVGAAGLEPTLAAVRHGRIVAFANKECLVCAGDLMMRDVKTYGATLIPVDSEHNAIFQVFDFDRSETVERVILTASGGPFRDMTLDEMATATPEEAVAHPNWDMGSKISVDSATMMNKGLELIEAYHLFPVAAEAIEVLVHPQSVVHSMVGYVDGSVLAQLGSPDMRTPIAYALQWPRRMTAPAERLDLAKLGKLTFYAPDIKRFPALGLAREALQMGGGAPTILNAANEVAVRGFLRREIGFLDIARIVESTLEKMTNRELERIEDVLETDCAARRVAREFLK